jgi:hypothetical protein
MVHRPTPVGKVSRSVRISALCYIGLTHSCEHILQCTYLFQAKKIKLYDLDGIVMTHMAGNLKVMLYLA